MEANIVTCPAGHSKAGWVWHNKLDSCKSLDLYCKLNADLTFARMYLLIQGNALLDHSGHVGSHFAVDRRESGGSDVSHHKRGMKLADSVREITHIFRLSGRLQEYRVYRLSGRRVWGWIKAETTRKFSVYYLFKIRVIEWNKITLHQKPSRRENPPKKGSYQARRLMGSHKPCNFFYF